MSSESRPDPRVEALAATLLTVGNIPTNADKAAAALLAAIDASPDIALMGRPRGGPMTAGEVEAFLNEPEARSSHSDVPDERSRLLRAGHVGMLDKTAAEPSHSDVSARQIADEVLAQGRRPDHVAGSATFVIDGTDHHAYDVPEAAIHAIENVTADRIVRAIGSSHSDVSDDLRAGTAMTLSDAYAVDQVIARAERDAADDIEAGEARDARAWFGRAVPWAAPSARADTESEATR